MKIADIARKSISLILSILRDPYAKVNKAKLVCSNIIIIILRVIK